MKSDRTIDPNTKRDNHRNLRIDQGHLKHILSVAHTTMKVKSHSYESKEMMHVLDKIDDLMLLNGSHFQPNNTMFKLNEHKWKQLENDLNGKDIPKEQKKVMGEHIVYNKAFAMLLKVMNTSSPDVAKSVFRLIEGFNKIVLSYQM
jgi:hypothetical protein